MRFLILFLGVFLFADIKVASWNLKNVSLNSLMFKKSISSINEYIKSNKDFDVIALQELRDKQIIYFLSGGIKEILFSPFRRYVSTYKGQGTHKEVYGFLVNKKHKVKVVDFHNYRLFKRPPFVVIIDNSYAVINVHLVYGKRVYLRKKEAKNLLKIIKILKNRYHINDIIIAGDFNLTYKNLIKIFKKQKVFINQKTTVGKKRFSKDYDHFVTTFGNGEAKVRQDLVKNRYWYIKNISDHVPIELYLRK